MAKLSLTKDRIRIMLLEGVHDSALADFRDHGYATIETIGHALDEDDLAHRIRNVHILGIRSRTRVTDKVLAAANRLLCIGCFCIGTNQVSAETARRMGVPVFNAPYSNTRSVAELVLGEMLMLLRRIPERSTEAHAGRWHKASKGSHEARGKTLGIVGYGHIGSQLSILAEALGMRVRYYDVEKKLAIGNAQRCASLDELLSVADVVTLHVPATPQTRRMIDARAIHHMKKGAHLINASRGSVVDIPALAAALRDHHLAGAAIDVFPEEPASDNEEFKSPLRGLPNVILTPHIGGSTQEAQENIGTEVAEKLIRYSDVGSTVGAVNFPEVSLPIKPSGTRFLHIHANTPGTLKAIIDILVARGRNVAAQYLQTDGEIGYVVVDVDGAVQERAVLEELQAVPGTIRARFLN